MNIVSLKGLNMDLTDAIKAYVETKLTALDKLVEGFGEAVQARVEVGKTTHHHKNGPYYRCEVNLSLPGRDLRAEEEREDLYEAIDVTADELKRQLVDAKERQQGRHAPRPDKE